MCFNPEEVKGSRECIYHGFTGKNHQRKVHRNKGGRVKPQRCNKNCERAKVLPIGEGGESPGEQKKKGRPHSPKSWIR